MNQSSEHEALATAQPTRMSEYDLEESGLAALLGDLARNLHQESSDVVLESVVKAALDLIPGTDEASLSIVTKQKDIESRAPSSEVPAHLDAAQMQLGEGPCLESIFKESTIRVPDMSIEGRWPSFAQKASGLGVGSMLAFRLFADGDTLGALNLYSRSVGAFDSESEHVGSTLAAHAALALAEATHREQLDAAVASRDTIGQAKGILMERYKITRHEAFLLLAQASSHTNRKLRTIADELVRSGELKKSSVDEAGETQSL